MKQTFLSYSIPDIAVIAVVTADMVAPLWTTHAPNGISKPTEKWKCQYIFAFPLLLAPAESLLTLGREETIWETTAGMHPNPAVLPAASSWLKPKKE